MMRFLILAPLTVLREHGGTIDVQSSPGRGTRFIVAFPALVAGLD